MKTEFVKALKRNEIFLERILDGFSEEQTLYFTGESNSIAWILGHICTIRKKIICTIKGVEFIPVEEDLLFVQGAKKDREIRINLKETLQNFANIGKKIEELIIALPDSEMDRDIGRVLPLGDRDLKSYLPFIIWHETFHIGQIDLIKAACGIGGIK